VPEVENEPDGDSEEEVNHETMFTFDAFELVRHMIESQTLIDS